jgi:hypothetical protein
MRNCSAGGFFAAAKLEPDWRETDMLQGKVQNTVGSIKGTVRCK